MSNSKYVIDNISKFYEVNNEKHIVLNNISLSISTSHITVILGESGCGKTTLLRVIANLEEVSSGTIKFIKDNEEYKPKVGLVFQESRLMPWLDVSENIVFHEKNNDSILNRLKNIGHLRKNKDSDSSIDEYLKMMRLQKFKNSYPNELSGGMAQRVSIARALYFNPDILLMDEPFSALDYFTRMEMQNELINIHKSTNKGVIFVTHDIEEALRIAKNIVVFTKEHKIREFQIDKSYDRDLGTDYYISLKKEILRTLNHDT